MSMRAWRSLLFLVAGCSFDGGGVPPGDTSADAAVDAIAPDDDGGGLAQTLRHDTAADFGATGAVLDQAQVEAWGAVGPAPRVVGALLARAVNRRIFTDADDATWEDLPADGATSLLAPPFIIAPGTLALSDTDWTLWLEGEIWLEAGTHQWQLSADDDGFVDIAPPTGTFARVAEASFTEAGAGNTTAAVAGWYRIRIALSQGVGDSNLDLRHQGPGQAAFISLPAYRYRTRAPAALRGLLAQGFDDRRYQAPGTVALQPGNALSVDYQGRTPQTLGIREGDTFAVRWSGQVRIDIAGAYTFRLLSDDGQRLTVDGTRVIDLWADTAQARDAVVELDVGWHDLAVDLRENTASSSVELTIAGGPDLVGTTIPGERVRPTLIRGARTFGSRRTELLAIPDNSATGAIASFRFDGPSDAVVTGIDLTAELTHPRYGDLEVVIRAPDGVEHVVAMQGRLPSQPGNLPIAYSTPTLAGVAASGTWQLIVRDRIANLAGSVGEVTLAVHHRGGESPVATQASYDSAVVELGAVVGFDSATWTARTPAGSSVMLRARTCAAAEACAAETWSAPLVAGAVPPIAPRRFVQYRAELATSGDAVPALDAFELHYRITN
jgi:subtilisin-like proprotein convertase family protein